MWKCCSRHLGRTTQSHWNPYPLVHSTHISIPIGSSYWCLSGNGWEWGNGIIINNYDGSFPHSLRLAPVSHPLPGPHIQLQKHLTLSVPHQLWDGRDSSCDTFDTFCEALVWQNVTKNGMQGPGHQKTCVFGPFAEIEGPSNYPFYPAFPL